VSDRRRILSIDGGGIKGVFPIAFLARVESELQLKAIGRYFDLIAGTSVGGIIALGLGLGLTARELQEFFISNGSEIFPSEFPGLTTLRLIVGRDRYRAERFRQALDEAFGTRKLGESKTRLLIPSFDATRGDIHIYKTAHAERLSTDYKIDAVDVALSTAAAPTYLPVFDSVSGVTFVDGALYANNPVALAVVEAVSLLKWTPDEIDVLSIGCTEQADCFAPRGHRFLFWARRALDSAMLGQSRAALGMAMHLTGRDNGKDNVVRVNRVVERGRFSLNGTKHIRQLQGLGVGEARHQVSALRDRFFACEASQFVPFYST